MTQTELTALQAQRQALKDEMNTANQTIRMHFDGIQKLQDRVVQLEYELDLKAVEIAQAIKALERARLRSDLEEMQAYCADFEQTYKRRRGIE